MNRTAAMATLVTAAFAAQASAVDFFHLGTIDYAALGAQAPGSVAIEGNTLYTGGLFGGGVLTTVTDIFGTPTVSNTAGSAALAGNGFVSIDTGPEYVVAATNNAGGGLDNVEIFDKSGNLVSALTEADFGFSRVDGVAYDPGDAAGGGAGWVVLTRGGSRTLFDLSNPAAPALLDNSASLWNPDAGSGYRDIDIADNGDLYVINDEGLSRGTRVGPHNFQTLGGGAGTQQIWDKELTFQSAVNTAALYDFNGDGNNYLILSQRFSGFSGGPVATDNMFVIDADVDNSVPKYAGVANPADFMTGDGSAQFVFAAAGNTIYDFSYDEANKVLAIADNQNGLVYLFGGTAVPAPASASLIALGLLGLARRGS
ncbi:hypothetical protein [Mucisphaera calidilacus]|uniref:PEP-CTERM protein-sorting domain-containing protein n=1 Tax=Mucisphaera calidilacus TaxID=2527982 RepID=A0A518C193_9BACT|nr:hypothetical protein [Mucisphaera calidilacus]QDU72989.1 hypothetical protein Pan265_28670 [Mucisphaera calidilacus]